MNTSQEVELDLFPPATIKEIGGVTHYSLEMLAYLRSLPPEEADRIVSEIEYRNRPRKVIEYPYWMTAQIPY